MTDLKKTYKNELALFYGDNSKLIANLKERIDRYSSAPSTLKVKERLELLKRLLEEAEE